MTWFIAITGAAMAGTPHCLGMCGPLAVAGSGKNQVIPYHLGRITTYASLGALAGGAGALPFPPALTTIISAIFLVGFSLTLIGWIPPIHPRIPGVAKAAAYFLKEPGPMPRYFFGIVNGLLPCGLLYATLAVPVASGSAVVGALLMGWFAILTGVVLSASTFGLQKLMNRRPVRVLMAVIILVAGVYNLSERGAWFGDEPAQSCH